LEDRLKKNKKNQIVISLLLIKIRLFYLEKFLDIR